MNEDTPVGSTNRGHDADGDLVYDGAFVDDWDVLDRLVHVERVSGTNHDEVAVLARGVKSRVRRDIDDANVPGNSGLEENLMHFYVGETVIEEWEVGLTGQAERQWMFGAIGDRFLEGMADSARVEKLDGSLAATVGSDLRIKNDYEYRAQGTVKTWSKGPDGLYFTPDDTAQVTVTTFDRYFSEGRRLDFESGNYLGGAGTRFYDPENGRKLQPSANMWQSSGRGDKAKFALNRRLGTELLPFRTIAPRKAHYVLRGTRAMGGWIAEPSC